MKSHFVLIPLSVFCLVEGYDLTIVHNGPSIIGGTITFVAELFDTNGSKPSGTYKFKWNDNAYPQHSAEEKGEIYKSIWNISYPPSVYKPRLYEVDVVVYKITFYVIPYQIASQTVFINVTANLNGEIELVQNGTERPDNFVSNKQEVGHSLVLSPADQEFINKNRLMVQTFWFLDCIYLGMSDNYTFYYNYTKDDIQDHGLSVMVIASNETVEPSTTTTVATTTVTGAVTTASTTTPATLTNGTFGSQDIISNDIGAPVSSATAVAASRSPPTTQTLPTQTPAPPPLCPNSSSVVVDHNKSYGFFYKTVKLQNPVNSVVVNGSNWLKHDVLLNLSVSCSGSPPFVHCVKILKGEYNCTGEETCSNPRETPNCQIPLLHYFSDPNTYTILFIISNSVSKTVTPFGVNIFEVKKHAQLSVIVVPITCSLVAVILVVFGVAYYIQSKRRYTVEVADFDFSKSADDTEYKTFKERLRDAVLSALNRNSADKDYSSLSNDSDATQSAEDTEHRAFHEESADADVVSVTVNHPEDSSSPSNDTQ